MGWAILDESAEPSRLDGDYTRDEADFAGYNLPHRAEPREDLDMIGVQRAGRLVKPVRSEKERFTSLGKR
jgi:hypothetical protein